MQIGTFLAQYTGLSVDALFNGASGPLLSIRQDAAGEFSFPVWTVPNVAPPTSEAVTAALAAGPTASELIAYAATRRWLAETGGITLNGAQIDTSRDSQAMIANAYAYVQTSGAASVTYKADSGWTTLTADQVKATALAVGAHVQACFVAENALDAEITAGTVTSFAQIDAYAWPAS
jgi:hypothetical protein